MAIKDIIGKTETPCTKKSLMDDFQRLGISQGDTVIVHSSLKQMGWVIGGAVTVIEALMETVTRKGNIVMPTHTGSNTDPKDWINPPVPKEWHEMIRTNYPPFRSEISPSSYVGVMPEVFRKYPEAVRSNHPTVSFAAWGKDANWIIDNHSLESGLGKGSPLKRIYDLKGKILLIGVDNQVNTSLHLAEDLATYKNKKTVEQSSMILVDGKPQRIHFEEIDWNEEDFGQIGNAFDVENNQEFIKKGKIGQADSLVIGQKEIVNFAVKWMEEHR